jgi:hypothetical protein
MEFPMTQLVHARESHVAQIKELLYTAETHTKGTKEMPSKTQFGRLKTICYLFLGMLLLASSSSAQNRPPVLEQLAKTYGIDSYGQIDAIRYTWNAQIFGLNLSRSWVWEPKTGKVSFEGKDKEGKPVKVSYLRSQVASQSDVVKNEVDPNFINDNYWLIFPFHAYWDKSATVTDQGTHKLPLGNGSADLVVVKYPTEAGGYTPGDTWELYVGKSKRVEQFAYHRGGPKPPSLVITTWAGYKKAGPLLISTEHRGTADGKPLHIFLSDVAVKLAGSNTWIKAQ